jgi:hypothetical protein
MKKSEILRAAKRRLENRLDTYVCLAVTAVCHGWDENPADKRNMVELNRWIMSSIHPYETYQEWLMSSPESPLEGRDNPPRHEVYAAKLFWMDWMIAHWEVIEAEDAAMNSVVLARQPYYNSGTVGAVIN